MTWLSTIAETSGHPTGGMVLFSVDTLSNVGEAVSKVSPIFGKGLKLVKAKKPGYHLAIGIMQHRFGPAALEQFRCISGEHALGFDVGMAIHAGQVIATPPSNLTDAAALAGFFLAHGIVDSPTCLEALGIAVRQPEYRIGVAVAVRSINDTRKGRIQKIVESVLMI